MKRAATKLVEKPTWRRHNQPISYKLGKGCHHLALRAIIGDCQSLGQQHRPQKVERDMSQIKTLARWCKAMDGPGSVLNAIRLFRAGRVGGEKDPDSAL